MLLFPSAGGGIQHLGSGIDQRIADSSCYGAAPLRPIAMMAGTSYRSQTAMYSVGKATGPHLMAELGDVRRFPHPQFYCGLCRRRPRRCWFWQVEAFQCCNFQAWITSIEKSTLSTLA